MPGSQDRSRAQAHVYLIGDSTFDVVPGLHKLLRQSHEPLLRAFFSSVYQVLRSEVAQLTSTQRARFPRFSSVQELLALQRHKNLHPALQKALICAFQLGSFVSRCGTQDDLYTQKSDVYLAGLCTGGLAAAAISSSRHVSDLLAVAPHTVGIAFRTALRACEVGDSIEQSNGSGSWSITITGLAADAASKIVQEYCSERHVPIASRPYISFIAQHGVTISGPPAILRCLKESRLSHYRILEPSLHAPYHAAHLFDSQDVDIILETTPESAWSQYKSYLPVISSSTGTVTSARDYRTQLQVAVEDILMKPISWDDLTNGIAYLSRFSSECTLCLHPIGTTADGTMRTALKQRGHNVEMPSHQAGPSSQAPSSNGHSSNGAGQPSQSNASASGKSKIAIVGMSGRFPEAENPDALWDLLFQGLDVHKVVPASRWNVSTHVDVTGKKKNTSGTPFGCWLNNPGGFDAKFFNMTPREAPRVDPASRLALMTAYEAMEKAGMVPGATPSTQKDRVGVAYGVTSNDWMEVNSAQDIDTFFIPGGCRAFVPGRINYFFKFSGPSYSIDTACSSSLSAIHTACNSLWQGDVDTVIAGGTNVLTNPDYTAGLDRGHFLSRTGNCKSFDESADGYCRAEGICTVILKRLDDAIAENDPILGVILGACTNHSAEADSITRPLADAQKSVFSKILSDASVDPLDISYVEMHGTGTQAGDPVEMESVVDTFAPSPGPYSREGDRPVYLGAVKSNVGHSEAAAGATSLAKVLLMMQNNIIPPHAGIKTKLNKNFPSDLNERNVQIAKEPLAWPVSKDGSSRKAFINNFSAAGGNTALLVEDAPPEEPMLGLDPRTSHIVAVSAKTAASLKSNLESLASYLDASSSGDISLPALSYTTTARRAHHPHRVAVRGSDMEQVRAQLRQAIERGDGSTRSRAAPKVTFAFTGNGSQYAGMGKQLYENFPTFRKDIDRFDQLAQKQGFQSVLSLCSTADGSIEEFAPSVVHVATVCLEMALARLWISWGIVPSSVVGHSLGEYAALNVAGVLSDADAIYLTFKRAQLLQEKCQRGSHAMLATRASANTLEKSLAGRKYEVACINGPDDVVISGTGEELRQAQSLLQLQQVKSTLLAVPFAFHSAQVDSILEDLEIAAQGVTFQKPQIPVICPLTSTVVDDVGTFSPRYLARHCREAVNMLGALRHAHSTSVITDRSVILEIGPQPVFCGMVKSTFGSTVVTLPSLKQNQDTWPLLTTTLSTLFSAGSDIDWREYHRAFNACHRVLQLPAYSWDLKDYWLQYVNDWSLRKGDPVPTIPEAPASPLALSTPAIPKLESTTIHKVVEDSISKKQCSVIVETDLSRPDLNPLAQGHKVNNIPLTTPSIYAEIAMRIGSHIIDKYQPQFKGSVIDVAEMTIERALVAHGGPQSQILRSSVEFDLDHSTATCRFATLDPVTQKPGQHSHCKLRIQERSAALHAVQAHLRPSQSRMTELRKDVDSGKAYRFSKSMIYKIVGSLAQFDPDYRQVNEIVLNSKSMDALSVVNFSNLKQGGTFHTNPAGIDALSQSAGFVMNGNENADLDEEVFVNHGWGSFQLFETLSSTKNYETYVKMVEKPSKRWDGDVLVLDGNTIVARFGGVTLQGVPRRVLQYILSRESSSKSPSSVVERNTKKASPSVKTEATRTSAQAPVLVQQAPAPLIALSSAQPTSITKVEQPGATQITVASVPSPEPSQQFQSILQIVSEETGIPVAELTDSSEFADLGIDSLLTLQITSRLVEEMEVEMGPSAFANILTIKQLREFLEPDGATQATTSVPGAQLNVHVMQDSEVAVNEDMEQPTVVAQKVEVELSAPEVRRGCNDKIAMDALQIISEESGVSVDELTDDVVFADMGVDSLLSLMVVARYREELELDVPAGASMFTEFPSVRDLKRFLSDSSPDPEPTTASTSSPDNSPTSSAWDGSETTEVSTEASSPDAKESVAPTFRSVALPIRPATSVILQGRPRTDPQTLVLFPDGSGCAASYANLPPVRTGLAIIGLNCPYYRHPAEMDGINLDELMDSYLTEVRRRQPAGPYHLGGWSSGGILAFRAAQMLIQEGEQVDSLVLLDAPPPTGLDPLPPRWYEHCAKAGIFGNIPGVSAPSAAPPATLVPHFRATVDTLQSYHADPLPEGFTPRTSIAWAGACVFDGRAGRPVFETHPKDPEGIKFLTEQRQDFSAGAWARLFPGDEPSVSVMQGQDHFGMMQSGNGERLAEFLSEATMCA